MVAVTKTPTEFHIASSLRLLPPPAMVVNAPGTLRIPAMALSAYRNAERMMAVRPPGCGVSWNLLAGIGRIESMHANGGATDSRGTAVRPIYGPALDGTLPGNEVIVQSRSADRVTYARAMGPMQFLPGTWSRYASDGDGDGKAEVQNLFDSTLAAARYLCSGGLNLRDQSQVMAAILRYNNSMAYARNVLGWAAAYATGVVPGRPAADHRSGPRARRRGDTHLDDYQGLGPGLPLNALGLPANDPLALMPLLSAQRRRQPAPRIRARPAARPAAWTRTGPAGCSAEQPNRNRGCRRGCSSLRSRRPSARCSASATARAAAAPRCRTAVRHRCCRRPWHRHPVRSPPPPPRRPAPAPAGTRRPPAGTAGCAAGPAAGSPSTRPGPRPDRPVSTHVESA